MIDSGSATTHYGIIRPTAHAVVGLQQNINITIHAARLTGIRRPPAVKHDTVIVLFSEILAVYEVPD